MNPDSINALCKILNKLSPQSAPSAVDGQAKIKATFFQNSLLWQAPNLIGICRQLFFASMLRYNTCPQMKDAFHKGRSGVSIRGGGGVSIIWAFWFWEHVHRASSYDSTTSCLGASLSSGNGGLYGYRKGRREGGGGKDGVFSESVRWLEMLTDTFSLVCRLLISLLFSRRLSAQVLEYTHLDVYVPVFSQYKEPPVTTLSLTCARAHAQTFYSWYMKSLSGEFPRHHGNPASGEQKLHLDCEAAHSALEQHMA